MYFMWNIQRKIKALLWIEVFFLLILSNSVYSQENSDYLKLLEGEASGMNLDDQTKDSQKKKPSNNIKLFSGGDNDSKGGGITELFPGLSQQQFELVLKNNYIGSYLFYKRLSEPKKDEIYLYYQTDSDPAMIRKKIIQVGKN